MAISKMKAVNVIGKLDKLDQVIDICCKSGCFEPEPSMNYLSDVTGFSMLAEENPYNMSLQKLTDIVNISKRKLELVDIQDFAMSKSQIALFISKLVSQVGALQEEKAELIRSLNETNNSIEQFSHFLGLDIPLNEIFSSKFIKVRFGRVPSESFKKLEQYNDNPYVLFFPCSSDKYYWGMYVSPVDQIAEVDRIFASLYFERLRIPDAVGTPEEAIKELENRKIQENVKLSVIDKKIERYWENEYELCLKVYTLLKRLNTEFEIRHYAAKYNDKFVFYGWVSAENLNFFKTELDQIDGVEFTFENPENEGKVKAPTALKNNRLFKPYEYYVKMFGVPAYNEIDPTFFVGITYTFMFGIMFADLGQGIVLSLVGYLMWKFKKMELGPILIRCGFLSAVFGLIFGSVFGFEHLLDPMYKKLFGWEEKPIEIMNPATINIIIFSAITIGIGLIIVAMILNIYSSLKRKDFERALFGNNGLAGLIFYVSIVAGTVLLVAFKQNIFTPVFIILCIVLPLIVMMFREVLGELAAGEKHPFPDKWGEFIMQNFFEVFEFLLSFLSNTISFFRVGAFVIVHAGMMMLVFSLAELSSTAAPAIIVIGNIFVMALEGLLVGIQGLRLEFYEMFSRFFDGSGRPFKPITLNNEN